MYEYLMSFHSILVNHQFVLFVDVTAVVVFAGDVTTITARQTNKELKKREIKLIDDSLAMITLVLWNNEVIEQIVSVFLNRRNLMKPTLLPL